ncbi:MAG TPA: divergent PAP2 family protein [Candidatus Moranbacteria bacterium]|nr:divergent PAP2 family protein [Candidatus Moranbacteria bacterium]
MDILLIVYIPILVGVITQLTKFIIFSIKHGIKWNYLFTHGHMPSMHSALVTSLTIVIGYLEGMNSGIFAFSLVFALIILDDALRIRMHLGDQGRYLNMLVQTLNLDDKKYPRLKERVGHRWQEVLVGVIYGATLTILLIYLTKFV